MVTINEGDDFAVRRPDGRILVMRAIKVSSVEGSGDIVRFMTLRSVQPAIKMRRNCMKCGFVWEGIADHGEPKTCRTSRCAGAELGRIEVKE